MATTVTDTRADGDRTVDLPWKGMSAHDILDLYQQDEEWIDRLGNHHKITEISDSYLENLVPFVTRTIHGHMMSVIMEPYPYSNGTVAQMSLEAEWDHMADEAGQLYRNPDQVPLLLALRAERDKRLEL